MNNRKISLIFGIPLGIVSSILFLTVIFNLSDLMDDIRLNPFRTIGGLMWLVASIAAVLFSIYKPSRFWTTLVICFFLISVVFVLRALTIPFDF